MLRSIILHPAHGRDIPRNRAGAKPWWDCVVRQREPRASRFHQESVQRALPHRRPIPSSARKRGSDGDNRGSVSVRLAAYGAHCVPGAAGARRTRARPEDTARSDQAQAHRVRQAARTPGRADGRVRSVGAPSSPSPRSRNGIQGHLRDGPKGGSARRLKIWLTEIGEPLPIDAGARLMRCGLLAQTLASRDHDVTWWASTFDHARKLYRRPSSETASPSPHLDLELLHASGYRRNVSLARIRYHRRIARQFSVRAESLPPPDLVYCY